MNLEDFDRDELSHCMAYLADIAAISVSQLEGMEDEFRELRARIDAPGVDTSTARDIVDGEFPFEWETPLIFAKVDLCDGLEALDNHLIECNVQSHVR